jgi:hypothetical protein
MVQPIVALLALIIGMGNLIICHFHEPALNLRKSASVRHFPHSTKSSADAIAMAKQLLGLPLNSAPGFLWRTYMTRLNRVPMNATIEEMKAGQVKRDLRAHLLYEGLPEWCPYSLINVKRNFETNVMGKLVAKRVYSMSPFCSDEEFEKVAAQKYQEYKNKARIARAGLDYDDWYAACITQGFGLPQGTSRKEAFRIVTRNTHIFGGAFTKEAQDETERKIEREDDLLLLMPAPGMTDQDLYSFGRVVLQGVHLESPDLPTTFMFFY